MTHATRSLRQAYRELPWRQQLRRLAWALAAIVIVTSVVLLEVHFSTQNIVLGSEWQRTRRRILATQNENLVLESRLAELTSRQVLLSQAKEQGYRPVSPEHVHYVPVPAEAMPAPAVPNIPEAKLSPRTDDTLPEAYTISLIKWLMYDFFLVPEP
ncbi:MAG: hypothetical protein GXO56_08115 [Chloroflexi bacterium]|nr:hypothetical protein [Chloroflexota bacterium]